MKKSTLIALCTAAILFFGTCQVGWGQVILTDDFTGTVGTALTANGWTLHSGTGTPFLISSPGSTYSSYIGSGIGNAASTGGTSDDVNRAFTSSNSGSLYLSFMYTPTTASTTTDYPVMLATTSGASVTSFFAKLYVQKDGSNNLRFGITKTTAASAVYTGYSYSLNTTYLIIIRYDFVSGTTNDIAYLFVNPVIGGTEPTATVTCTTDAAADPAQLTSVCLRQSATTAAAVYDGFRVGRTWGDVGGPSAIINVTGSFSAFTTTVGTPSASQYVDVSGTSLTGNINVSAVSGYEYSTTDAAPWTSTLSLDPSFAGKVYVRLTGASVSSPAGTISFTSTGATQVDKAVTGVVNPLTPVINVTGTFSAFTTTVGTPSSSQAVTVSGSNLTATIEVSAVSGYEYSTTDAAPWTSTLSLALSFNGSVYVRLTGASLGTPAGTISFTSTGAAQVDKAVSGTVTAPPPVITVTGSFTAFSASLGNPSVSQSVTVAGSNLTATIEVSTVAGFEYSTTNAAPWTSTLSLASSFNGSVYVRLSGASVGPFSGTINFNSTGATQVTRNVTGTVTACPAATLPFVENFDYATTTLLNTTCWANHSGTSNYITVGSASISYPGYASSLIGNEVSLTTSGEDVNRAFTDQTSGSVYAAFLVNVSASQTNGDYFFHIGSNPVSGNIFQGRVYIKKNSTNTNFAFGLNKQSTAGTLVYSGFDYIPGTTYLVVVKYTFNTGSTTDDVVSLFVNPTINDPEPTPLLSVTDAALADLTSAGFVALRQGTAGNAPTLKFDGLRVATSWAEAVAPSAATQVEIPTFTPPGSTYYSTQNVTINCATSGATIYYSTTSNTGPWTVYSSPISVPSSMTIWSYATKSGMTDSPVAPAVYTIIVPNMVTNIAALRAGTVGTTVYKLTGEAVLTYKTSSNNVKYIQDASGAIMIYDVSGKISTPYNIYDGITGITGTLTLYNNMLEFIPIENSGAATSTNNVVVPEEVTLLNLTTAHQAKLIRIKEASITGSGNFVVSTNYPLTDPTGSAVLRTAYADLDYIGQPIPTTAKDITGVLLQYAADLQLVPRSLDDFMNAEPTNHATAFTAGTTTTTTIPLTWTDATSGSILPEAYLIKGSSVSYAAITDPVDGTPESDGGLVKNISQGTGLYTFTDLTPGTPYFFKIYSYTGSGTARNYKTGTGVPQATGTTLGSSKTLSVKVFLEGPYAGAGEMSTTLNTILPLSSPYGTGETIGSIPNADIVDWILVEPRVASTPENATEATKLAGWPKSYFLKKDGSIVALDGSSLPDLGNPSIGSGNYLFVVVRHRNHLSVMSNYGLALVANSYVYDFSTAITQAYGGASGYKELRLSPGVFGMVDGDADGDLDIGANDFTVWSQNIGLGGYAPTDIDMDADIGANDFTEWSRVIGLNNSGMPAKAHSVNSFKSQVPK